MREKRPQWKRLSQSEREREQAQLQARLRELRRHQKLAQGANAQLCSRIDAMHRAIQSLRGRT